MPTVKLLSWTANPIQTVYRLWQASKNNDPVPELRTDSSGYQVLEPSAEELEIFQKVIDSKIPVAENINFVFLLDGVSISFREQMVRHRIGVKVGDRLGVDLVPDLADSTWWSQSMRILDMGTFYEEGRYRTPESVHNKISTRPGARPDDVEVDHAEDIYERAMMHAQESYKALLNCGVPMEDAREVIPLAATHRISWSLNLAALQHIIGKRGCWILQLGLWEPIIRGMVEELARKVHPVFRGLIAPPCVKGDAFTGCIFRLDNERRVSGEDKLPPCSLYVYADQGKDATSNGIVPADQVDNFYQKAAQYANLWGRDPFNGKRAR